MLAFAQEIANAVHGHGGLWIGYAVRRADHKVRLTKQVWATPLVSNANRYVGALLHEAPNLRIYEPGCWAHTDGTPKVHPNENQWYFVLVRVAPVL